jgi:hypothetical protein
MTAAYLLRCARLVIWLYAGIALLDLAARGFGFLATIQRWRRVPESRPSDISQQELPPPEEASDAVRKLEAHGFERLGEFSVKPSGLSRSLEGWVFVDASRTTHVEVCVLNRITIAVFISTFHDDAILETGYPSGAQSRDDADYRVRIVSKSVDAAYDAHLQQLADFQFEHGEPRKMSTMEDFIAYSTLYNTRYARRQIARTLWRHGLQVGSSIYALVIILGALLIQGHVQPLLFLIGVGVLLLPAIMVDTWFGVSMLVDRFRMMQLRAR